jgi:signal transduction histidine kinase
MEEVPSLLPEVDSEGESAGRAKPRWGAWKRSVLSSLGLSPVFRAYLFLGSLVAILAFLLYSESLVRQLREQEKDRVDLYARLITLTPLLPDEQAVDIFTEVIHNPSIDFPIVFTNHRGEITLRRGVEGAAHQDTSLAEALLHRLAFWEEEEPLVPSDTSATTLERLHQLIREMDARNPPIVYYPSSIKPGLLYRGRGNAVITDTEGELVKWQGPDLPSSEDTTAAALIRVQLALQGMETSQPLAFAAPAAAFSYLHHDQNNAIITNDKGEVIAWRGTELPALADTTAGARARVQAKMQQIGQVQEPLVFRIPSESYIHYGDSELVSRVSLASLVQIVALLLFALVGYIGYRNIKRSEQRSIWVGMTKETAHQLGTPLSSLSGWLELIRHQLEGEARQESQASLERIGQMVGEMQRDMDRLKQIASRFSQIGSVPELEPTDVGAVLEKTIGYFTSRGPQFGQHRIHFERQPDVPAIPLNAELMSWAFENLFKNAMDALEGEAGAIRIHLGMLPERPGVRITFQDEGRGIEPENINRIFEPGFSTKKRGWGLGLAFVKRIVEEYHRGRISVVQSAPGGGTTFEIVLPTTGQEGISRNGARRTAV